MSPPSSEPDPDSDLDPGRRRLLVSVTVLGATGLAGCNVLSGDGDAPTEGDDPTTENDDSTTTDGSLPGDPTRGERTVPQTPVTERYREAMEDATRMRSSTFYRPSYDYDPVAVSSRDSKSSVIAGGTATPVSDPTKGDRLRLSPGSVSVDTAAASLRALLGVSDTDQLVAFEQSVEGTTVTFVGGTIPTGDTAVVGTLSSEPEVLVVRAPSVSDAKAIAEGF